MIFSYNDFLLEIKKSEYKPLEGSCGCLIGDDWYQFNVGKIIEWCKKNYDSEDLPMSKIKGKSFFLNLKRDKIDVKDGEGAWSKKEEDGSISMWLGSEKDAKKQMGSEFKNYHKMTQDEWDQYRKEQMEVIEWADLRYPIICVSDNKGEITSIIDGNHRVAKSEFKNRKTIKAYVIPEKEIKNLSEKELNLLK